MKYYIIPPSASLARWVRFFWVFEGNPKDGIPYIYRSMADGCAELLFHFKGVFNELNETDTVIDQSFGRSLLSGPAAHYRRFVTTEDFGIFGAYLYPFAIPKLLSLASTELSNQMPDLDVLFGAEAKELEEKVMLASDNLARVKLVSAFLEKQFAKTRDQNSSIISSIKHIIHSKGPVNIEKTAADFFLSKRQFERKFKEFSGFSPKFYSRIVRFQSAVKQHGIKNKSLTEIAYDCGYYDQSHFIHEFKEFSGYHPRHFFSGTSEGAEVR
jgi:AraC-like DNA-binding protein